MAEKRAENRLTISVAEAAVILGISRNLAYKLAREKRLPGVIHLGDKRMIFSAKAIERLLEGTIEANQTTATGAEQQS